MTTVCACLGKLWQFYYGILASFQKQEDVFGDQCAVVRGKNSYKLTLRKGPAGRKPRCHVEINLH